MKNDWKSAFYFTAVERRGIITLLFFTVFFWLLPMAYPYFIPAGESIDLSTWVIEGDSIDQEFKPKVQYPRKAYPRKAKKQAQRFRFDPNQINQDSLELLGFPEYLASRLIKYRKAGGRFKKASDLEKLYGLSPDLYQELKAWIHIEVAKDRKYKTHSPDSLKTRFPSKAESGSKSKDPLVYASRNTKVFQPIGINSADAETFRTLYGIGPVLSDRIVKFRDKLGGFHQIEQIRSVYGLADSTWLNIRNHLELDHVSLKQIDLNQLNAFELSKHPYLNRKMANIITKYRKQHGDFSNAEELKAIHGIEPEQWARLLPYLSFESANHIDLPPESTPGIETDSLN